MNSTSINVNFVGTSSFTPAAPSQRTYIINNNLYGYNRYAYLSQDSLTMVYYTSSVVIPFTQLFQAAASASSAITWPPVMVTQPTSSLTVTHPAPFYLSISASSEVPATYQWQWQSSSLSGYTNATASQFTGSTTPNLTCSVTAVGLENSASFYCIVQNSAGNVTSSTSTTYIL